MKQILIFEYQKEALDDIEHQINNTPFPMTYSDVIGYLIELYEKQELSTHEEDYVNREVSDIRIDKY